MRETTKHPSTNEFADKLRTAVSDAPIPFPHFVDDISRGSNRFVQFSPERDCRVALEFLRRIDPSAHAAWWVREVLSRTTTGDTLALNLLDRSSIEATISHPSFKERIMGALSVAPDQKNLDEAAHRFGCDVDPESGNMTIPSLPQFTYATAADVMQKQGESCERIETIPERHDPAIFFEHLPTQCGFATAQRMKAEGEQDADCVRHYLNAYKKFMESPCVGHLIDATAFPKFGDSYTLTMKYCLNNRVSEDFIALLHVVFPIQWVIEGRAYSSTPVPGGSKGIFREDAELLKVAIKHYCQRQRPPEQS